MKRASLLGTGLAVIAAIVLAGSAMAAGILTNGSFENTQGTYVVNTPWGDFEANATNIPGWTTGTPGSVDWIGGLWVAQSGGYSVDLNGTYSVGGTLAGSISTTFDTTSGQAYFVSFYMSGNPAGPPTTKTMTVQATGGASQPYSYDTAAKSTTTTNMQWVADGYAFTASGSSTTLTFTSTTVSTSVFGPALDNVTVTPIVKTGAGCKDGGWATMSALDSNNNLITFKNQGQCVSYFATSGAVPIGN